MEPKGKVQDNKPKVKKKNKDRKSEDSLNLNEIQNLMRHDSYSRHNGAVRQRTFSK